ncbi:hypothetical protein ACVBEQ_24585 [Nakamurella sp. GG22]
MSNLKNTSGWLGAGVADPAWHGADAVMARPRTGLIVVFGDRMAPSRSGVQLQA